MSKGRRLSAGQRAQLGQRRQEQPGRPPAHALNVRQPLHLGGQERVGFFQRGDLFFQLLQMTAQRGGQAPGFLDHERVVVVFAAVLLLRDQRQQFLPARDQTGQPLPGRREGDGGRGLENPSVFSQHGRVQGVRLGQKTFGAREVTGLARIDQRDRHPGRMERRQQSVFMAAGGFADEVDRTDDLLHRGQEGTVPGRVVGKGALNERGMRTQIEGFVWRCPGRGKSARTRRPWERSW